MTLAAFDTLEFVETLKEAGIPEKQAKAFSTAVRQAHESLDVATKQDIVDLRKDLAGTEERIDVKLKKLGVDLRHEMDGLRYEIGELRQEINHKAGELRHEIGELRQEVRYGIGDLRKEMKELALRQIVWLGSIVFLVVNAGPLLPKLLHLN